MPSTNTYVEEISSQIPAVQLLIALGWQYLTPDEALRLRGGKASNVVLTGVLEPWLRAHNDISYKGQRHAFSDASIREAIERLVQVYDKGELGQAADPAKAALWREKRKLAKTP